MLQHIEEDSTPKKGILSSFFSTNEPVLDVSDLLPTFEEADTPESRWITEPMELNRMGGQHAASFSLLKSYMELKHISCLKSQQKAIELQWELPFYKEHEFARFTTYSEPRMLSVEEKKVLKLKPV